ncbi:hypothetical protein ACJIZ3_011464 [Penstemon smallii]|uniref:Reverse transcriptase domain-containing protein n=1 Tax=Penstemon smallii TaxID=265156 RepID=A0ABD3UKI7_9LAMI
MKILSWNCRGLAQPGAVRAFKALLFDSSPDLLFLCELKTAETTVIRSCLNSARLSHHFFVPPVGLAGGLCLAWKHHIDLEILTHDNCLIHAVLTSDSNLSPWLFTGIHCSSITTQKTRACFDVFFKNLFKTDFVDHLYPFPEDLDSLFPSVISNSENEKICSIPTPSDIKKVMFSMASNKSPGPDGFPPCFFKSFWHITGTSVIQAVQAFFKNKLFPHALNHTLITLIPKIQKACRVEHFRPISLCNVVYKIISKIIALRLKAHLDKFIAPNQMAFLKGRSIQDNTIISHEIMHYLHKKKGKKYLMAIKVDLAKAFDRVEWPLLIRILKCFGFCDTFTDWIFRCISSSSFSLLINGHSFGHFTPSRGIRQGDPLSPYLFIVYAELLSRILLRAERNDLLKGIKISRTSPPISHLFYADDLIVFCRATIDDANAFSDCIDLFSNWSSELINKDKTVVHFSSNTPNSLKNQILFHLGFKECNHKEKHLGLPFCKPRSRTQAFSNLIEKLSLKLSGWKSKCLSQAGRTVLIKSVAQSLPIYHMNSFLIPKTICYKLDSLMLRFWWGKNSNHNILALKKWDTLCTPKSAGGLGFRKTEDFNSALVSKLSWHLANNSNFFWVSLLQSKYLHNKNFFDIEQAKPYDSWLWKDIVLANCLIDISQFNLVKSLMVHNSNNWNLDVLHCIFDLDTVHEILKTPIDAENETTKLLWTPSKSGVFLTKSAYLSIIKPRLLAPNFDPLWKKNWKAKIHDRHKIFLWKLANDSFPTKSRLAKNFPIEDTSCCFCFNEAETIEHLFFNCPFAEKNFFCSKWKFNCSHFSHLNFTDLLSLLLDYRNLIFQSMEVRAEFIIFCLVAWDAIWRQRNNFLHGKKASSFEYLLRWIHSTTADHLFAQSDKSICAKSGVLCSSWQKPKLGYFKFNSDSSFKDGSAFGAFVMRDSNGSLIHAFTSHCHCLNVEAAEARALLDSVRFANTHNVENAFFESDNLNIIQMLLWPNLAIDWASKPLVDEIRKFWHKWPTWRFKMIQRNTNQPAHNLASWAASCSIFGPLDLRLLPLCIFCDGGYPFINPCFA